MMWNLQSYPTTVQFWVNKCDILGRRGQTYSDASYIFRGQVWRPQPLHDLRPWCVIDTFRGQALCLQTKTSTGRIRAPPGSDCQVVPRKQGPLRFQNILECCRVLTGMLPFVMAMEQGHYSLWRLQVDDDDDADPPAPGSMPWQQLSSIENCVNIVKCLWILWCLWILSNVCEYCDVSVCFRYDHYSILCELLPVGLPSLSLCLLTLSTGSCVCLRVASLTEQSVSVCLLDFLSYLWSGNTDLQ